MKHSLRFILAIVLAIGVAALSMPAIALQTGIGGFGNNNQRGAPALAVYPPRPG